MRHYPLSTLNSQLSTTLSPLQGFGKMGEFLDPAVALRFTAGYAVHTPSGVKSEKQKFH
ncbi:MAG: hypothetical protein LBE12_17275 [Planctomycetaceae bacterium]|nr:hypothetical protein [Planctomycetaceae bacterium]